MSIPQRHVGNLLHLHGRRFFLPEVRPGQEVGYVICNTGRILLQVLQNWMMTFGTVHISKSHCLVGIDTF